MCGLGPFRFLGFWLREYCSAELLFRAFCLTYPPNPVLILRAHITCPHEFSCRDAMQKVTFAFRVWDVLHLRV